MFSRARRRAILHILFGQGAALFQEYIQIGAGAGDFIKSNLERQFRLRPLKGCGEFGDFILGA
jgi:hypothetical protein